MHIPVRYSFIRTPDGMPKSYGLYQDKFLDREVLIRLSHNVPWSTVRAQAQRLRHTRSDALPLVFDVFEGSDGRHGIVEQYVEEQCLADWLAESRDDAARWRVAFQVASGGADLHQCAIAHGRIGSQMFAFDGDGLLRLLPWFGLVLDPNPEVMAADVSALISVLREVLPTINPRHPLATAFNGRTSAQELRDLVNAEINRNQHRAIVTYRGRLFEFGRRQPEVELKHPNPEVARVKVAYDGLRFWLVDAHGEVDLNGMRVATRIPLPGPCVVGLGDRNRPPSERHFFTFDPSRPEVVL